MSILQELKSKSLDLLEGSKDLFSRSTDVYDASRNYIMIAGFRLDGVTSSVVSSETIFAQEQGIHSSYHTYYDTEDSLTLTVNTLPTASCNEILNLLAFRQKTKKAWFKVTIVENGITTGVYRGFLLNKTEQSSQKDAQDRQWVFGLVTPQ